MAISIGSRTFQTVDELEALVIYAATQYDQHGYAEDQDGQEVSDPEYDELYKQLKTLKPTSEAFKGTTPSEAKPKGSTIKHDPPMTSIAKADGDNKAEIYEDWKEACVRFVHGDRQLPVHEYEQKGFFCQAYKRDGVALRVNYIKGVLVSAGLRPRDGVNGSDVTRHMPHIEGVPAKLRLPLTLSLNGEIECWHEDFAIVNAACDAAGEEPYKNPRNYTAGCMGRDAAEENKDARLRIAFYSVTGFDDWAKHYSTEVERAQWVNGDHGLGLSDKNGKGYYVQVQQHNPRHLAPLEEKAKKLPYYTDGIVLKINDLAIQEAMGHSGDDPVNPPRGAIAWKFMEETAEAVVAEIEWNASRTGRVVPTAIFAKPVILADTENTRATCNNYGWMESQGLGPGATVQCKKGGKIIPNIMRVIKPVKDLGLPKDCPACHQNLMVIIATSGNKDLMCLNKDCGAKQVKSWLFFLGKLGGKGLGLSAMEKILATGKVKSLAGLFDLTIDDLMAGGFSDRQALLALATIFNVPPDKDNAKLIKAVEKARSSKQKIEAWKFFAALGISGAGETVGKALVAHYKDFEKIRMASFNDLMAIDGIGEATAYQVAKFFMEKNDLVSQLLERVELELPVSGKLTGQNFCLTGSFNEGKKYWQSLIEAQGGNVQSSVGKSTTYLVQELGKTDGTPSDKEAKAAKLGVPIIDIVKLQELL